MRAVEPGLLVFKNLPRQRVSDVCLSALFRHETRRTLLSHKITLLNHLPDQPPTRHPLPSNFKDGCYFSDVPLHRRRPRRLLRGVRCPDGRAVRGALRVFVEPQDERWIRLRCNPARCSVR